jgi:hypothetical protein
MEREHVFRRMLELDAGEGHTGRMAIIARFLEARAVWRVVAASAVRLRLPFPVTGLAGNLPVSTEKGKTCIGVFVEEGRLRSVGVLSLNGRVELRGLGVARFQNEVHGEKRRHEDKDEYRRSILSHERPAQSPQSPPDQRSPWQLKQDGSLLSPPRRFCPWHRTQLSNGLQ